MCNRGSDDYCLLMGTVHKPFILKGMTGRLGITKAKWLDLRSLTVVAEGSGVVLDRIMTNGIRVVDKLKTAMLRMEEWKGFDE
jgi:hypothetical protein